MVPQVQRWCGITTTDTGRTQDAHFACIKSIDQRLFKCLRACQFARQRLANTDGQGGWHRSTFFHDIKVGVERRYLVNFSLAQLQFFGQGAQMRVRQTIVAVLNEAQKFDQQIAPTRTAIKKGYDIIVRCIIKLATFGRMSPFPLA
jgi:hypothetical protein